jgi:predicted nucleic acid-binding Zn ribbon protein
MAEDPDKPEAEEETPPAPSTRYEEAQAKMKAKYGDRPKKYKGRWRGFPRKKRKKKGPVDLGRLVYEQLRRHVPLSALRLERLQQAWPRLVTPRIAKRTWPVKLYGKRLVVLVHDNQWLHELGYLQQDIVERIALEMPDAHVDEIKLRLGKVPEGKPVITEAPQPKPKPPLSGEVPQTTQDAIAAVQDPELRKAIEAARRAFGGETT